MGVGLIARQYKSQLFIYLYANEFYPLLELLILVPSDFFVVVFLPLLVLYVMSAFPPLLSPVKRRPPRIVQF